MTTETNIEALIAAGKRIEYASGSQWEPIYGYTRAVRFGPSISIAGTTAPSLPTSTPSTVAADQTRSIFSTIDKALTALGGSMGDITRVRVFLRNEADFEAVMTVHGEVFARAGVRPAATALAGVKMALEELLVEIEVDAIVGAGGSEVVRLTDKWSVTNEG
ncbi:Endoribonuclease L-PSP/chorismate mutase-like protein [Dioszegia hungarica]|uniref:Endoribonuclease L-PSP/chorismate mutase-like protein n=1 Tax=Dioszegia hungarica TaxID=4972 RepID=A0AA38LTJ4_9TREE|nr:Endoribonuclease L-PSP/chorismate mutase-like protein [Dioszegia hungarica]KAI9632596.1 Endoribonuclease L-PSP/chorismate mutase-like protein [Dioszegia hungarica]